MKYQITYDADDDNGLIIHVRQRLVKDQILCIDPTDDFETAKEELSVGAVEGVDLAGFYAALSGIDGIEASFLIERYTIFLAKGNLYSWSELQEHVVSALELYVARNGKLEEVVAEVAPAAEPEDEREAEIEPVAEES